MDSHLHGKRILITREKHQAEAMADKVQFAHGVPIVTPLLEISCKQDPETSSVIAAGLKSYHWIIITSANGVHCFFRQLKENKHQLSLNHKFAVVGTKTAKALERYGKTADFIPSVFDAQTMMEEFLSVYQTGESCLLVRGNRSRNVIPEAFTKLGIVYESLEVYETNFNQDIKSELREVLAKEKLDFITFTSPSTVEAFHEFISKPPTVPVVCIGSTTAESAKAYGCKTVLRPGEFTIDGMIETMSNYIKGKGVIKNESI